MAQEEPSSELRDTGNRVGKSSREPCLKPVLSQAFPFCESLTFFSASPTLGRNFAVYTPLLPHYLYLYFSITSSFLIFFLFLREKHTYFRKFPKYTYTQTKTQSNFPRTTQLSGG